jgi:hypothetical protein
LGPPHAPEIDTNGIGPADAWGLQFACGLKMVVWQLLMDRTGGRVEQGGLSWVEVHAADRDLDHLLCHLPIPVTDIALWTPDATVVGPKNWWVRKQDDNGQVFDMAAFSSRCEAMRRAAELEARGHKQAYTVEHR